MITQSRVRVLLVLVMLLTACSPATQATTNPSATTPGAPTAAISNNTERDADVYTDPEGRFSVPIPTGWTAEQRDGFVVLSDPEQLITGYALVVANADPEPALAEAWQRVDPAWTLAPATVEEPPPTDGVERLVVASYDDGNEQRVLTAHGQLYQGLTYVLLWDADSAALERRAAQAEVIETGYAIAAIPQINVRGVTPARVDAAITNELAAFTERMLAQFNVPGAVVAVVQNGEVVYINGFGVRNAATGEPLTPQTRMMIGSTGKSLTTLMMASLVDDGTITWDTPAQQILPSFAVQDPALSKQITMRNLVCACTGVPRRDLELVFNADDLSAEAIVASLSSFEFYTPIGEVYQYSNQMVASGGYIAALADNSAGGSMLDDYEATLQGRVLDPIGMPNTTLSFKEVEASGNYAVPHSQELAVESAYLPRPLSIEYILTPAIPAGGHWSTAEDMAQYLITQLNRGVAPNGTPVVSAERLEETWQPQVPVDATTQYGLGWYVGDYKGQPLIHHGGNTLGFTSDFAFLPDAGLGILILANGQGTNVMNEAIRTRLWELVFAQPAEAEAGALYALEQANAERIELASQISDTLDVAAITPLLGRYTNDALGPMSLALENDKLVLDSGEFRSHLRPLSSEVGQGQRYVMSDPPLPGLLFRFTNNDSGRATMLLEGFGLQPYTFTARE
jgi:CubicO group peptidase (beta-lactamase class C family)